MAQSYDLVVIGAGPGGYVAAIRAAQLGMRVACVDERDRLGGTCLNIGCIPSKALLHSTAKFEEAETTLRRHGILLEKLGLDLGALMSRKDEAVRTLTTGLDQLFRKNKIHHIRGRGRLRGRRVVEVESPTGSASRLEAPHIIVATGSVPQRLADVQIDENRVLSSEGALRVAEIPEHLIVVGGGYIGLELGSVWRRLGARVTCVEMTDRLLSGMDAELAEQMKPVLERQGFTFRFKTSVTRATVDEKTVTLHLRSAETGGNERRSCSHALIAVGRRPYTDGLDLYGAGVAMDDQGFIQIDRSFRTTVDGIYAIGDVVRRPMLAHKAEDEGMACVEGIAGRIGHVNYDAIPAVVYTSPEVASVGRTEAALRDEGIPYRAGRFPFTANSRARCMDETRGFVKILAHAETDLILGAHMVGPDVGTLIHEVVTAMELGSSAEELGRTCHGHPTLNEAVREAALSVHGRAIHV